MCVCVLMRVTKASVKKRQPHLKWRKTFDTKNEMKIYKYIEIQDVSIDSFGCGVCGNVQINNNHFMTCYSFAAVAFASILTEFSIHASRMEFRHTSCVCVVCIIEMCVIHSTEDTIRIRMRCKTSLCEI